MFGRSIETKPLVQEFEALTVMETGDHLSQPVFHARYEKTPKHVKAELVEGVVYLQASLKRSHGRAHSLLMHWLSSYEDETPGVEAYDNVTMILGTDSEPQPDACLIVLPEKGGQTRFTEDDYLKGAPEFIGEVASSSEAIDLHAKKRDYLKAGVREYLVLALRTKKTTWFVNRDGSFEELPPASDGTYRSEVFPGLWLDPDALLALDGKQLLSVLRIGTATQEHAEFQKQLAAMQPPK